MAEFDEAMDAEHRITGMIMHELHRLRREASNDANNFPGDVQAAKVFVDLIVAAGNCRPYVVDDHLHVLALHLADSIDGWSWGKGWAAMDWSYLSDALRGWARRVEALDKVKPNADERRQIGIASRLIWDEALTREQRDAYLDESRKFHEKEEPGADARTVQAFAVDRAWDDASWATRFDFLQQVDDVHAAARIIGKLDPWQA